MSALNAVILAVGVAGFLGNGLFLMKRVFDEDFSGAIFSLVMCLCSMVAIVLTVAS